MPLVVTLGLGIVGFFIWRGEKKPYCGDVYEKTQEVKFGTSHFYLILYNKKDTITPFRSVEVESMIYSLSHKGDYTCQMAYKNQVK